MRKRLILTLGMFLLVAAVVGGGWWYERQQTAEAGRLRASGMLEATEVNLAPELGGQLATLPVREGEPVEAGAVVATFDTTLLDRQIATADDVTRLYLERERARQTLQAPFDGWVVRTVFEPKEVVAAGMPVVVVADWRELTLKVYLPEDQFGRVSLGQMGRITVDAYPGASFAGQVSFISSEAEFTPRTVQTQEDRVKSVYAIKLRVPNPDLRLKPGMFADAVFAVADSSSGR